MLKELFRKIADFLLMDTEEEDVVAAKPTRKDWNRMKDAELFAIALQCGNCSRAKLAKKLGISASYVGRVLNKKQTISSTLREKLILFIDKHF